MPNFQADHQEAALWAYAMMQQPDQWCILDSETTGLYGDAEICQLAVIDPTGQPLIDKFICPVNPIPSDATAIHGITNEMVIGAKSFPEVFMELWRVVGLRQVVIYNAGFDLRLIAQSLRKWDLNWQTDGHDRIVVPGCFPQTQIKFIQRWTHTWFNGRAVHCLMEWYAQFCGEWNNYHGNYRWQKLPAGDHTAIGDCRAALKLMRRMADSYDPEAKPPEPSEFKPVSGAKLVEMPKVGTSVEESQYDEIPF